MKYVSKTLIAVEERIRSGGARDEIRSDPSSDIFNNTIMPIMPINDQIRLITWNSLLQKVMMAFWAGGK